MKGLDNLPPFVYVWIAAGTIAFGLLWIFRRLVDVKQGTLNEGTTGEGVYYMIGPLHCSVCKSEMILEKTRLEKDAFIRCPYCESILEVPNINFDQIETHRG
jgi:hypothetical protein